MASKVTEAGIPSLICATFSSVRSVVSICQADVSARRRTGVPSDGVFAGLDIQRHHRPGERRHEPGFRELLGREVAGDLGRFDAGLEHRPVAGRRLQLRQRRFGVFERGELRLDLGRIGRQPIERGLGSLHLRGRRPPAPPWLGGPVHLYRPRPRR